MNAGDGSSLQLPPAFVMINPRQHRRYKKGNQDQVDGRTTGAKNLMSRINKRKMKEQVEALLSHLVHLENINIIKFIEFISYCLFNQLRDITPRTSNCYQLILWKDWLESFEEWRLNNPVVYLSIAIRDGFKDSSCLIRL